jgi:hypothetical protein
MTTTDCPTFPSSTKPALHRGRRGARRDGGWCVTQGRHAPDDPFPVRSAEAVDLLTVPPDTNAVTVHALMAAVPLADADPANALLADHDII